MSLRQCCSLLCVLIYVMSPAMGEEQDAKTPPKPTVQELSQWVMTYYQHPEPDQFVVRVRRMAEFKVLRGNRPEANEMFLGKVMEANPKRIADWLDELSDLEKEDAAVVHRAAWVSQTEEAKSWLKKHDLAELADQPPPPLLANAPMVFEPYHLDLLWEWFFATGDDKPVKRIIGFFHLLPSDPEPGQLPTPPSDKADRFSAVNYRTGRPAFMSTLSLAVQQDRVLEILKACEHDPAAKPRCRAWITQAIQLAEQQRAKAKAK